MLRKIFILVILLLVISTTFTKNHTKKLDQEIFIVQENINYLNSVKELVQLDFNYLSSPEKLLDLNTFYVDEELKPTKYEDLIIISNIKEISFKNWDQNEQRK